MQQPINARDALMLSFGAGSLRIKRFDSRPLAADGLFVARREGFEAMTGVINHAKIDMNKDSSILISSYATATIFDKIGNWGLCRFFC